MSTPESGLLTVLIDDVRVFRDGRPCMIARSSADGVSLLTELQGQRVDHLWLDHDLAGEGDIWPVIRLLEEAHLASRPLDIVQVHVQASRAGPAHQICVSMTRLGYHVERSYDLRMWTR